MPEDNERSGRPRLSRDDENVGHMQTLVRLYRWMTIQMISDSLNLSTRCFYNWKIFLLCKGNSVRAFCRIPEHRFSSCEGLVVMAD